MSQKGSSVLSSDNIQNKYKKALGQINKLHQANMILKEQSQEIKADFQRQMHELNSSMQQMEKEYHGIKNEKMQLQKILDEIEMGNSELKKYNRDLQKEMNYLNEVLTEQNTELKKVNAFKDEKGLTLLITTYQNRQITYRKDISRYQETIKSLKNSCESLENQLSEERRQRYKLEDLNGNLKLELNRYRELNNNLLNKNQSMIANFLNKNGEGKQKYREAEFLIHELSKQLEFVKNTKLEQQFINKNTVSYDNYESLLQQKNQAQAEINKLRQKLQEYENKLREVFQIEETMKRAEMKAEQLQQECNLLKSKLIVVETKDFMERSGDIEFNQFEEKVFANIGQNQSFPVVKNTSDSSHFQLMKAYIVELKQKLSKAISDKKQYEKKYRSLKDKMGDKIQKTLGLEEQNKLLKGKLQGFQRLSERLQYELQKNLEINEQEIEKMKNVTNSILTKKAEEIRMGNAVIKAQLDLQLQKFEKTQKNLRQEVQTLKLEIVTFKLKNLELTDKLKECNDFLSIYMAKFQEKNSLSEMTQETNQILSENVMQYEQLYREERAKNEFMITQKQIFLQKVTDITEELQRKSISIDELNQKIITYQNQLNRVNNQLTQSKKISDFNQSQLKGLKKQLQEKISLSSESMKPEGEYSKKLQSNYQEQTKKNRQLEFELKSLKLRMERSNSQIQKVNTLQDQLNIKNNELNDLKRKTINLQKKIGVMEAQLAQNKSNHQETIKENSVLKSKLLQNSQQIKKNYQVNNIDQKRTNQKLNEQIMSLSSELRQQKRSKVKIEAELDNFKSETRRLEELIEQQKKKQMNIIEEYSQLKYAYESLVEDNQRNKSELKFKNSLYEGLNSEINVIQDKVFKLNQENTELRLKYQSIDNDFSDLRRQIGGLKMYLNDLEEFSNSKVATGNWQEQRYVDNLSNFVFKFKKILRVNEVAQQNTYKESNFFLNNNQNGSTFGYKQEYQHDFVMNSESERLSEQKLKFTPQITSYGIEEFKYRNF